MNEMIKFCCRHSVSIFEADLRLSDRHEKGNRWTKWRMNWSPNSFSNQSNISAPFSARSKIVHKMTMTLQMQDKRAAVSLPINEPPVIGHKLEIESYLLSYFWSYYFLSVLPCVALDNCSPAIASTQVSIKRGNRWDVNSQSSLLFPPVTLHATCPGRGTFNFKWKFRDEYNGQRMWFPFIPSTE